MGRLVEIEVYCSLGNVFLRSGFPFPFSPRENSLLNVDIVFFVWRKEFAEEATILARL